jgi:hypothetical protein
MQIIGNPYIEATGSIAINIGGYWLEDMCFEVGLIIGTCVNILEKYDLADFSRVRYLRCSD